MTVYCVRCSKPGHVSASCTAPMPTQKQAGEIVVSVKRLPNGVVRYSTRVGKK